MDENLDKKDTNEVVDSIDERFQWLEVDGKHILDVDYSNIKKGQEELSLKIFLKIYDYMALCPDPKSKIRVIHDVKNSDPSFSIFMKVKKIMKGRKNPDVSVAYGTENPMIISMVKTIGAFLPNKPRIFKNRAEAIEYALKF